MLLVGFIIRLLYHDARSSECQISQIYSWNRTLHVSDSISVYHQESSTVHTAMGHVRNMQSPIPKINLSN